MEIVDLSWNEVTSKRFNHSLLQKSIRGIIVGKSGCGKMTLLLNFYSDWDGWITITFMYSEKVFFNPNIEYLKKPSKKICPKERILDLFNVSDETRDKKILPLLFVQEWAGSIRNNNSDIKCNFFETASDVPDLSELNS